MRIKKQFLKLEEDFPEITVGLIRLTKPIPENELFFNINKINTFYFRRIDDIKTNGEYFNHCFSRYQAYDGYSENHYHIISNKSVFSEENKMQNQLFSEESNVKFLLNLHQDVDYILTNSDMFADFSLILLPENLIFQIQEFSLSSDTELYQLIQYYE